MDGEVGDRPVRQDMGNVSERVLVRVEPGIGRDVDLPFGDILPVMAAGRHAQDLDHAGGGGLVAIGGGVGYSQAHGGPLFFSAVIPGWSEGPDPESRDSGFDASHRPGMTVPDYIRYC